MSAHSVNGTGTGQTDEQTDGQGVTRKQPLKGQRGHVTRTTPPVVVIVISIAVDAMCRPGGVGKSEVVPVISRHE